MDNAEDIADKIEPFIPPATQSPVCFHRKRILKSLSNPYLWLFTFRSFSQTVLEEAAQAKRARMVDYRALNSRGIVFDC